MQYPAIFLKTRLDDLYDEAARSQGSWEASKLLCLGGSLAAGVAAATNPVMMLFAIGSGCAYGWSIVKEGSRSNRFKPLPIFTSSIGELLSGIASEENEPVESFPTELKYLPPEQTTEALLLDFQIQSVARFLASIEEGEREQAYKQLVKYFHHQYGAVAQHRPSLLFNSDSELQEAFESALSFPAFESGEEAEPLPQADVDSSPQNLSPATQKSAMTKTVSPLKFPTPIPTPKEIVEIDLAKHLFSPQLGQDLKSALLGGESGAGKGNIIFGMTKELLRAYPDAQLYAVNPKPAKNESNRWADYQSVLTITDEEEALEAFEYIESAEQEMIRRQQQGLTGDPYVLVLDEFNTLLDLLTKDDRERFMKKVKRIIRQGRSNRVWLWVGMHTGNCDDIGISAPDRTNFIRIAVGFQGNCDALQIAIANPAMFPGLRVPTGLISSLKTQGFGICAASLFDKIFRLPNYLERCPAVQKVAPMVEKPSAAPLPSPTAEPLPENLPTPEEAIADRLKELGVRKTERRGVAIFKVWKWAQNQKGAINLKAARERFRKDRRGKITQAELSWSLEQLAAIELIEYEE